MGELSSSPTLFGTDGIRAPFGSFPLDRPTITALGRRLAGVLTARRSRPQVVLGGDTRESTEEICRWLAAGLEAGGAAHRYAGVLPSPGIAFLVRRLGAAAGISVSASHNPHPDNGIKLIDESGFKWSREAEGELERLLRSSVEPPEAAGPPLDPEPELAESYLRSLVGAIPEPRPLEGLRVVLDTANGAAVPYAGRLFQELGAEAQVLFDHPDGRNINSACGSTHPQEMARVTVATGSQLGIAFDGDADRAVVADEKGKLWDGDAILFLWAGALMREGELDPPRIVATSMSNLGLERALDRQGIGVVRCGVGDRVVVETMRDEGIRLGGEQSGHLVDLELSTTGDGLMTALRTAHLVHAAGRPLSELLAGFHRFPQILRSTRVDRKPSFDELPLVVAAADSIRRRLGNDGRLVLRYSGTEPLARVMIEGPDESLIDAMTEELLQVIRDEVGTGSLSQEPA